MSALSEPRLVTGWLEDAAARKLSELAAGKDVLEVGTYQGLSTLHLASTARRVHTVDWHRGDEGTGEAWTLPDFAANLRGCGVEDVVVAHVGRAEDVLPMLPAASFDLVFIDGAHDLDSVRHDLGQALRLVRPGGKVALHDWPYAGVRLAAAERGLTEPSCLVESLAVFDVPEQTAKARVFVALPCYDAVVPQALPGLMLATDKIGRWTLQHGCGSLLALVFNRLWVGALNSRAEHGWTHFAMHHADIQSPPGWLDVLVEECERTGADVLSVVVPIKDGRGVTSTGIRDAEGRIRRLTMKEVHKLPETFDGQTAGVRDGEHLVLNTGLWVCRFDRPWVEEFKGFNIMDLVQRHEDGVFRAHALPEDWNFSRWCAGRGLKIMATRKVSIVHHGKAGYTNSSPWGDFETDPGDN